ncbi:hypothetical protein [Streptomyces acidiscabies]|uniref:hypothetical protein n=1 Tax=Streptomyces acidiscabies TaxID=42234 RepID=UPI0038F6DEBB
MADRIGTVNVSAVQLLLPLGSIDVASRPPYVPSMLTREWCEAGDPQARTAVEVTVSSGRDETITRLPAAETLADLSARAPLLLTTTRTG